MDLGGPKSKRVYSAYKLKGSRVWGDGFSALLALLYMKIFLFSVLLPASTMGEESEELTRLMYSGVIKGGCSVALSLRRCAIIEASSWGDASSFGPSLQS